MGRLLPLLLVLLMAQAMAQPTAPLRMLVSTSYSLPFADIANAPTGPQLRGGILLLWGQALAEKLGRPVQFMLVPPRRVASQVQQGSFDLQCFESPDWFVASSMPKVDWLSQPLMDYEEILVGGPDAPLVRQLSELEGRTVGVVNGYKHPLLEPLFASGKLIRSLAPSEDRLLQMQRVGRTDYSVLNPLQLAYAQSRDASLRSLQVSPLLVARTPLYCLRHKQSRLSLRELAEAQQSLLSEGRLADILRRFR
ncbi:transporter substrate-binding domain-containing protein [Pelomonas sp. SE-A7]|uniref:substrate-binding periplasmic protein n=1 Tax=Pelomonas sp. SE-A7 TaxID=3054953 RepID=UPI00259CAD3E|nr:transporter substrate-binding domain-containing protein [Pelomonas sp. SE-A7]MDM4768488.1 transporter substrate-binding domain-containing protein [Pelomonas sp. SE-A7]